ncbi:MAG: amino acid adenylation domain-containing protein, partial [Myxococcota bacterium]
MAAGSLIDAYPLTPMQSGMLFHSLLAPESGVYVEQRWCEIRGPLDTKAFFEAWQTVVDRHAVLRTEFHWQDMDQPLQAVFDRVPLPWREEDWRQAAGDEMVRLDRFLAEDRRRGFELDRAPLMRCALFRVADDRWRFVWTHHHLLMDGWCNGLLLREVLQVYRAASEGREVSLPAPVPYRSFVDWLQAHDVRRSEDYWRRVLDGCEAPGALHLPGGTPAASADEASDGYATVAHALDADLGAALERSARTHRLTLSTLFQGALALLLGRMTGTDDVLFGAAVSGRPTDLPAAEQIVGLFLNTVPVRVDTQGDQALLPWLRALHAEQSHRDEHAHASLIELQRLTDIPSGVPMFQTLLVFENYPVSIDAAIQGLDPGITLDDPGGFERTNYPLSLFVHPGDAIRVEARFETERYGASAIERLCTHLETLLRGIVTALDADAAPTLDRLPMLGDEERRGLVASEQGPPGEARDARVSERVDAVAAARGETVAVVAGASGDASKDTFGDPSKDTFGDALDYATVAARSTAIASRLVHGFGLSQGMRVGLFLERTAALPVAMLGVLKAGAAFVPLAPDHPEDRLRFIAEDAGLDLVLHDGDAARAREALGPVRLVDLATIADEEDAAPLPAVDRTALAYLLYTSGSTGRPKGVAIGHGALENFLDSMARAPGLAPDDVLLAVTTISFDISILELLLPLTVGARLVIAGAEEARDGPRLIERIARDAVTVMQATPATWRLLVESGWTGGGGLRVLCGGEALPGELARALLERSPDVWNLYGPTETTIWSAALRVDASIASGEFVPIGRPIAETELRVVDAALRRSPVGALGELLIGGAGLSPGYWLRPDLTSERFVHVDDGAASPSRLYRTGDLVRRREDGLLDFVGRTDSQIKLRGFRIELGEIEAVLLAQPSVEEAVVVLHEPSPSGGRLVAFVRASARIEPAALRAALRERLPDYMVPALFVPLEAFPLTPNRKIDRRALRARADGASEPASGALPARRASSPRAEVIAGVFRELLDLEEIASDHDFFELGGHSLSATRLVTRLSALLDVEIPLRLLFEHSRFDDFVQAVERLEGGRASKAPIPRQERPDGVAPVSDAQRRQWLLAELAPESPLYGIPTAIRITGTVSFEALDFAMQTVVERHEMLRTRFEERDGEVVGVVESAASVRVARRTIEGATPEARERALAAWMARAAREPFDLAHPPLWRMTVLTLSQADHVLVFHCHHILVDGWSIGVLVREIATLYDAFRDAGAGPPGANPLPALPIQYADYVAWSRETDVTPDLDYWRAQLAGLPVRLGLPTDHPPPVEASGEGDTVRFALPRETRDALQALAQSEGTTLFMTLLAAFAVALHRVTGETDLAIGTPVANRDHPDVEDLIGLFVNTLVLRVDLAGDPAFEALLERVRA